MQLIEIPQNGRLPSAITLDDHLRMLIDMTVHYFEKVGFLPPWVGYIAMENSQAVGTCAFKSRPVDGRVEIAYDPKPDRTVCPDCDE